MVYQTADVQKKSGEWIAIHSPDCKANLLAVAVELWATASWASDLPVATAKRPIYPGAKRMRSSQ
jgi:hypothetical protein